MARPNPEEDPSSAHATRVLRQFRVVFNSVRRHFSVTERKAGVSGAQAWALSLVRDHPLIGVGGLAKAMDVHQSTASNLVRALSEEGLVVAARDSQDRRAVRLEVTAKGRRVLRSAPHPYSGVLPDALGKLDKPTLKRLERDLGELIEVLDPSGRGAHRPLGQREED